MLKSKIFWLIGVLTLVSLMCVVKGCRDDDRPNSPTNPAVEASSSAFALNLSPNAEASAKAVGLKIEAVGLNDRGEAIGPVMPPVEVANPRFPLNLALNLFRPPCRYELTVTTALSRSPAISWSTIANICLGSSGSLTIDPYEAPLAEELVLSAPDAVLATAPLTVSCAARGVNAPDMERFPVSLTLSEQGGMTLGPVLNTTSLSGQFPDPFSFSSAQSVRMFTCTFGDSRLITQSVMRAVARALPTPTPAPPTPTPIVITVTPGPTVTPAGLSMTANAAPPAIGLGATSVITAQVTYQGNPVAGATVNFAHTQGLGALNPAAATSDAMGLATSAFIAGTTPGLATIYLSATAPQGAALTDTTVAIAVPTPTPTPTMTPGGPTPTPTATPTMTPTPTATPTSTPVMYTLDVTKTGTGTGTVVSTDTFINCGTTCSYSYAPGTLVTLQATPDAAATFVGWTGGGCSGTLPCVVTMNAAQMVSAYFAGKCEVINTNDSGAGSLRNVLQNIATPPACTSITFVPAVQGQTIAVNSQLTLNPTGSAFTIDGGSGVTVQANNTTLFSVANFTNVTFANLTITGAGNSAIFISTNGRATIANSATLTNFTSSSNIPVYNQGILDINGTITGNIGSGCGGIINYGTLNVNSGANISNNQAINLCSGGSIWNNGGTVTLANGSTVSVNFCNVGGGYGGGIVNQGGGTLNVGGVISGNYLSLSSTTQGGGIYNDGSIVNVLSTARINGNSAYDGGGFFNYGSPGGTVDITAGAQITGNTAIANGGGIFSFFGSNVTGTVNTSTIYGNSGGTCANYYNNGLTPNCQF